MFLQVEKERGIIGHSQFAHGTDFLGADRLFAAVEQRCDLAHRVADGEQAGNLKFLG
ncbi:hypothetical protein D3C84_985290 [compost metagenome]